MEWINDLAQNKEAPILAAFALGLLTAIAPCAPWLPMLPQQHILLKPSQIRKKYS